MNIPNYRYVKKPDEGQFDNYDTFTSLSLFPAMGISDRLYLASDTNTLYRYDTILNQYIPTNDFSLLQSQLNYHASRITETESTNVTQDNRLNIIELQIPAIENVTVNHETRINQLEAVVPIIQTQVNTVQSDLVQINNTLMNDIQTQDDRLDLIELHIIPQVNTLQSDLVQINNTLRNDIQTQDDRLDVIELHIIPQINTNYYNLENRVNQFQNVEIPMLQGNINILGSDIVYLTNVNNSQNTILDKIQFEDILGINNTLNAQQVEINQIENVMVSDLQNQNNLHSTHLSTIDGQVASLVTDKISNVIPSQNITVNRVGTDVFIDTIQNIYPTSAPTFAQVVVNDIGAISNNPNIATNNKYVIENCRPIAGNSITLTPQTAGALSTHGQTISTVQPISMTSTPTFANIISSNLPSLGTHVANLNYISSLFESHVAFTSKIFINTIGDTALTASMTYCRIKNNITVNFHGYPGGFPTTPAFPNNYVRMSVPFEIENTPTRQILISAIRGSYKNTSGAQVPLSYVHINTDNGTNSMFFVNWNYTTGAWSYLKWGMIAGGNMNLTFSITYTAKNLTLL